MSVFTCDKDTLAVILDKFLAGFHVSNKVNFQNYFANKLIKMVRFFEAVQKPRSTSTCSSQHVARSTCACSLQHVCMQLVVRVHAARSTCACSSQHVCMQLAVRVHAARRTCIQLAACCSCFYFLTSIVCSAHAR